MIVIYRNFHIWEQILRIGTLSSIDQLHTQYKSWNIKEILIKEQVQFHRMENERSSYNSRRLWAPWRIIYQSRYIKLIAICCQTPFIWGEGRNLLEIMWTYREIDWLQFQSHGLLQQIRQRNELGVVLLQACNNSINNQRK